MPTCAGTSYINPPPNCGTLLCGLVFKIQHNVSSLVAVSPYFFYCLPMLLLSTSLCYFLQVCTSLSFYTFTYRIQCLRSLTTVLSLSLSLSLNVYLFDSLSLTGSLNFIINNVHSNIYLTLNLILISCTLTAQILVLQNYYVSLVKYS